MNNYSSLSPFLTTVEDRNELLDELQKLSQVVFSTDSQLREDVFERQIRNKVSGALRLILQDDLIAENLQQLIDYLHQLSVIQIVLGFDPSTEQILQLASEINQDQEVPRLLEIKVNPEIVGGIQIAVNGKYGDFSLRKKIDLFWDKNKNMLIKDFFTK